MFKLRYLVLTAVLISVIAVIILLFDDELPTVITIEAFQITSTSANSGGEVTSNGVAALTQRGVCWSSKQNPTIKDSKTNDISEGNGLGKFTSHIRGLKSSTTYYVKAYATNSEGTGYGKEISFTTEAEASCPLRIESKLPTLTTLPVTNIKNTTANGHGNIKNLGYPFPTQHGICWSTSKKPEISDSKNVTNLGKKSSPGSFTAPITGLKPGITYYIRAYATNSVGTAYGDEMSFTMPSMPSNPSPPFQPSEIVKFSPSTIDFGTVKIEGSKYEIEIEVTSYYGKSITLMFDKPSFDRMIKLMNVSETDFFYCEGCELRNFPQNKCSMKIILQIPPNSGILNDSYKGGLRFKEESSGRFFSIRFEFRVMLQAPS